MALQNRDTNQFEAYFQKADLNKDGRISGAEAVSFFQGSNLSKNVLAQVWMHADRSNTGFLGRSEFYNALKLVTVAQSKRELTPDIVKAALYGPASAKIPAPQIGFSGLVGTQLNSTSLTPPARSSSLPPLQNVGPRGQSLPNTDTLAQQHPPRPNQIPRHPQPMPVPVIARTPHTSTFSDVSRPPGGLNPSNTGLKIPGFEQSTPTSSNKETSIFAVVTASESMTPPVSSIFGGDVFSVSPSSLLSSTLTSSASAVSSSGSQPPVKLSTVEQFQSSFKVQSVVQSSQSHTAGGTVASAKPVLDQGGIIQWPTMAPSDVQKYSNVFVKVVGRVEGRMSGEQARNLFLSWRLPREVLKQVWDLSDQDNDSMLSLREFCVALYLMERFREGKPIPSTLPNSILFDDSLLRVSSQPNVSLPGWGPTPGLKSTQGLHGSQPIPSASATSMPQIQAPVLQTHGVSQPLPKSFRSLEDDGQNSPNFEFQNKTENKAQVEQPNSVILSSKEKIQFYQAKMQDLVLYKRRCENRLNEITEKAAGDKKEMETLEKKYEEKYKQVSEIAAKLAVEEATCRDLQARKMELHQAIGKVEQGGSADGILQVRADRIQVDIEELIKSLSERCKLHGLEVSKSASVLELPLGWHDGVQDGAAEWDEDWDKFDDEGFSSSVNPSAVPKQEPVDSYSAGLDPVSLFDDVVSEESHDFGEQNTQLSEPASYTGKGGDDLIGSLPSTPSSVPPPPRRNPLELSDIHSPTGTETETEANSTFQKPNWGFENNDDMDSIWGFDSTKGDGFIEDNKGMDSVWGESNKNMEFSFGDSQPGTPVSVHDQGGSFFDQVSRFDSFSESRYSPKGNLSRFDSMASSSQAFGGHGNLSRFDSINSSNGYPGFDGQDSFKI